MAKLIGSVLKVHSIHMLPGSPPNRTLLMEGKGSLEEQLEAVKSKASEIATKKDSLRKVEELGAHIEEALIFDNKYVHWSPEIGMEGCSSGWISPCSTKGERVGRLDYLQYSIEPLLVMSHQV